MATAKKPAAKKAAAKNTTTRKPAAKPMPKAPAVAAKKPVPTPAKAAVPAAPAAAATKPAAAKPATTTPVPRSAKPAKVKKPKQVRDSFTMPKDEYAALEALKLRASKLANPVKKSELLRAGVKALAELSDAAFLAAVKAVPTIKTGRPSTK
ncbi:MAG: hypothetical protein EOO28_22100 [Comamonadaceae bacterium]|nr:MAG: hypothetical protein EOO28_22100 [Comamonadaceae bacterium]